MGDISNGICQCFTVTHGLTELPFLDFHGFPVDGHTSAAFAMPQDSRKGIYIYRFKDGTYYASTWQPATCSTCMNIIMNRRASIT